ncbi:MAG: mandelate racemase/muconate lactonizing enzyme family protein, partial [bacterium]
IIGQDPRQTGKIESVMDEVLKGHGYAKAAIDAACWDILGKSCDQPVWMLMGGKLTQQLPMYRVAPIKTPEETIQEMEKIREQGYRQFQIKVGANWAEDIERIRATVPILNNGEVAFADANTGWRVDHALKVCRAVRDLDLYIEQPCLTYEECQHVRRRTDLPMKLDECIDSLQMAERVVKDHGAEVVCIKISKQGGLTKAKKMRDYLVEHRIPMVVEDTWGGEIVTAALAHLATSTPDELHVNSTDLHNYVVGSTGIPAPETSDGCLLASNSPGLGVEADLESLGAPVATFLS